MKHKERNSSFELLRIFSMFFIVAHHYAFYGTFNRTNFVFSHVSALRVNLILLFFGKVAVDIFVMIGAYFLSGKIFNFKRPVNLAITTVIYSLSIFSLLMAFAPEYIWNKEKWFQALLPFPSPTGYWFVDSYLFMLLMMPILNLCLKNFSLIKIKYIITLLFILWSLFPTFTTLFNYKLDFDAGNFGYSSGTYFLLIYIIGGYLRKKGIISEVSLSKEILKIIFLVSISVMYVIVFTRSTTLFSFTSIMAYLFNPVSLLLAISIFKCFLKFDFHNNFINYLSGSMFGVYLLHENSFIRPIIWQKLSDSSQYSNNALEYLMYGLQISLLVFVACIAIDILFRRILLLWPITKLTEAVSRILARITKKEGA